jgi:multiple sugar transport system substrate-binding protein
MSELSVTDRRTVLKTAGAIGVGSLAGCGGDGGDDDGTETTTEGNGNGTDTGTGTPQDQMSWLEEAASDYEGQTVTLVTESTPASLFYKDQVSDFQDRTGITVQFQDVAWGEMYNREVSAAVAGESDPDIGYIEQDAIAAFAQKGWVTNLTEFREENPDLAMPNFAIDDFVPFGDNFRYPNQDSDYHAYPMESFLKLSIYREDVYEQVSGDLSFDGFASNPEEYMESAQVIDENTDLAGHSAQVSGVTGPYALVESYWPLFGVNNWGINLSKWTALESRDGTMNTDAAVQGLEHFRDLLEYAPDGVESYGFSGVADAVTASQAAQGMTYSENFGSMVQADKEYDSSELDAALPWVQQDVLQAAQDDEAYIGYFDGGGFAIMQPSDRKEAAYLFIQYLLRQELTEELAAQTGAIVHNSALDAVLDGAINNATGYFDIYENQAGLFNGNPVGEVQKALVEGPIFNQFHSFIAGNITARECANEMAWQTERTLNQMGYLGSVLDERPF